MDFTYKGKKQQINRYPKSNNKSLRPWSAADELMLDYIEEENLPKNAVSILNDRFGFLSTVLHSKTTYPVIEYRSQGKAIKQNIEANGLYIADGNYNTLFSMQKEIDLALVKVPKSLDLFELYLCKLAEILTANATVVCSFMTRNFSPKMVEIANKYFEDVSQSKAQKKARLLVLKTKKTVENQNLINEVTFQENTLKQYFGVFSAKNIDYATQFLLENLTVKDTDYTALDLASGNGIIASQIRKSNADAEIHLLDDSFLAVESSKLNLQDSNSFHHQNDGLEEFQNNFFELIVTNPPFHFEYETNIDVPVKLFKEAKRCLSKKGRFLVVGNHHLNYRTHLIKLFSDVQVLAENDKFVIYECLK